MASNSTIAITFKLDGDNKGLKMLSRDMGGFKKVMSSAIAEATRLDAKLVNFAALSTTISGAASALNSLKSALGEYTQLYAAQQQAEAQLEEVMRQRMSATAAEVQSIKDLASAQQQLGVIGDEVQLAGAQQVATFLKQKSSIETLLPAMNDLLAKQQGLNATSEGAVSVGTLLGKAMQGQTNVLKKAGITLTEAQELIMKYGDESERAATLAQAVTDSVGHMNAKLASTDSGKMKQLQNTMGDIGEEVGRIANSVMPFLSMAAAATTATTGVIRLVGGVKAAAVAVATWNVKGKAMTVVCRLMGVEASRSAAVTRVFSSAMRGGAYSATALKLALRGLMVATGIGIAIAALTAVVELFIGAADKAADATDDLIDAQARAKREAQSMEDAQRAEEATLKATRSALQLNISRLKEFNGSKAEERKLVKEMNDTYGETMGYFSSVSDWYKTLTANSEAYCRQIVLEARARILANQIAQKEQENYNITHNSDGSQRKYSTVRKTEVDRSRTPANTYSAPGMAAESARRVEIVGSSAQEKAQAAYDANTASINALTEELDKVTKESASIAMKATGSATRPDGETTVKASKETDRQKADKIDVSEVLKREMRTVADYEEAIRDLKLKQKYSNKEQYDSIQLNIEALEKEKNSFEGVKGKLTELEKANAIDVSEVMGRNKASVADFEAALEELKLKQKYASAQQYTDIQRNINAIEAQKEAFTSMGRALGESQKADSIDITEVMERNLQSIADYDRAIQDLTLKQRYAAEEDYKSIQKNITALEKRREAFTSMREPINEAASTLKEISQNIDTLTKDLETASVTEAAMINKQIDAWNRKAEAIRNAGKESRSTFDTLRSGWSGVRNLDTSLKSLGETLRSNSTLWDKVKASMDAFFSIVDGIRSILGVVQLFTAASKAHTAAKAAETAATIANTSAVAAAAAEAPVAAAAEVPLIASNKALAATFLEAAAASYMAAHAYIPFAGFGIGAGFAISAAAIVKSMGLMAFANGGIAYGPTLGLFGEYAGASNNPEVVAPLDKLKQLIQPQSDGIIGEVEFKIKGETLVGVLNKTNKRINRTL